LWLKLRHKERRRRRRKGGGRSSTGDGCSTSEQDLQPFPVSSITKQHPAVEVKGYFARRHLFFRKGAEKGDAQQPPTVFVDAVNLKKLTPVVGRVRLGDHDGTIPGMQQGGKDIKADFGIPIHVDG
jgi:hypothetical protein